MRPVLHGTLLAAALLAGCGASTSKVGPTANKSARNGPIAFERSMGANDADIEARSSGQPGGRRPPDRQIFVRSPDGAIHQLTYFRGGVRQPAWSPDGSRIAFVRRFAPNPDQVWTMRFDGGGARAVADGCTGRCTFDDGPSYSPDGRQIAFERVYGPILHHVEGACPGCVVDYAARVELMVVDATGGTPTAVRSWGPDPQPWEGAPVWSPDGKHFAVPLATFRHPNKHTSLGTALFVLNADGSGARRITPWALGAGNPGWSRDGTKIVFNSFGGHSSNIYVVRPDGSGLAKLLAANRGRTGNVQLGQGIDPAWSPDGKQIVFESETNPCYSGSGVCDRVTPQFDLYTINADGSDIRRLTTAPRYEAGAAWGPARG